MPFLILLSLFLSFTQVGGVHFSLLSKVRYDIGDSCSLDNLIDSIFPLFRNHIEPDLHHAQVEPSYELYSKSCLFLIHKNCHIYIRYNLYCMGRFCRSGSTTALSHLLERQSTSWNVKARFVYVEDICVILYKYAKSFGLNFFSLSYQIELLCLKLIEYVCTKGEIIWLQDWQYLWKFPACFLCVYFCGKGGEGSMEASFV